MSYISGWLGSWSITVFNVSALKNKPVVQILLLYYNNLLSLLPNYNAISVTEVNDS